MNSDRKIIRGVRVGDKTYTPGQEDELDKVLSVSEVTRLTVKGYIEGKWSGAQAEAPKPADDAKAPEAKATTKDTKKEK